VIRLPVTHADTGVSEGTERRYDRSQRVRSAYCTLRRDGRLSKRDEGFEEVIGLLNEGTDFEGSGTLIELDGSARQPRRAVVEVDSVPLNLTLADVTSVMRSHVRRAEKRHTAERERRQREFVLLGTSALVMSMLLQVLAVVLFE
jgi:hypothetical protein